MNLLEAMTGVGEGEKCPPDFAQLPVVYENSWSDYEEGGWVIVFDFLGELFVIEGGYCVMVQDNTFDFNPDPLLDWEFEQLKQEWEEFTK